MRDSRLDQSYEWIGHWWRPDHPDVTVAGVLTYDPEKGVRLRLIGGWPSRVTSEIAPGVTATHDELEQWPVLHGLAGTTPITLVEALIAGAVWGFDDTPREMTLAASALLIGCHLASLDSADFVGCEVTVENLTGWAGRGRTELNLLRPGGEERAHESVSASHGHVEVKLHLSSGTRSMRIRRDGRSETRRSEAAVTFRSTEARPMEEWFSMMQGISDLVSLSTMSACAELTLTLYLKEPKGDSNRIADSRMGRVDVFHQSIVRPDAEGRTVGFNDFVLTEADLPWAQLIPAWMDARERFSAARSMILGLRYVTSGYLDTRVVTAVGAGEAFHRALEPAPPIDPDEFAELRALLLDAVPKDRKSWLNDRIQFNEPSLRMRLLDLAERPGPFMKNLVPDPARWAREAVRARNDLAHRGTAGHVNYDLLNAVVEVTSAVVVLNLLREVGVPPARLAASLTEHSEFRWAAALAREHFTAPETVRALEN